MKKENNKKTYQFHKATGALKYTMTNDYLFRMVLQRDKETLTLLICSLLHLTKDQVVDVYIDNPVEPGATIANKEYQLDIVVKLNGDVIINLEMQVINYNNWTMRSLAYLCRKFDSILKGTDYNTAHTVYQIGFLDFTLFEEHPEFFAKYQMRNAKDNYLYTDKFNLFVIDLNRTDMATDEDKFYGIDTWASLFKATTWEEIKMITDNNPSLNSTAEAIFMSTANQDILEQCRIREDNIVHEKLQAERMKYLENENKTLTNKNETLTNEKQVLTEEKQLLSERVAKLEKLLKDNGIQE